MKYDILLLDADDTLFDFGQCERAALQNTLCSAGLPFSQAIYEDYSAINLSFWKMLERGEIDRDALKTKRFEVLAERTGLRLDAAAINRRYGEEMAGQHFLIEGARDFVEKAARLCRLYIVTNGMALSQERRFVDAGLVPYITDIFISEKIGTAKPDKAFFDHVFAAIPDFDAGKTLIVGDSLSSDIAGGINAGIDTCWFNPAGALNHTALQPVYEVRTLQGVLTIISDKG
ncbi:MAG: noncanonical pyrimidine nucleotidase, YjjG family [Clostridiales bacterium]|nr:noncanonical pyrimidine nucleotidase, YjjG family [Clostridiales bacterium]